MTTTQGSLLPLVHERPLSVLVACEYSGRVRDAFIRRGHNAVSCDLRPTDVPGPHVVGDVMDVLDREAWDMLIAHPPCTYLAWVGQAWFKVDPSRYDRRREAVRFVERLWNANIEYTCIENPRGALSPQWRLENQVVQPWMFGEPYTKATCLWLRNLPPLLGVEVAPRPWTSWVAQVKDPYVRSLTFSGIANAMASQWGTIEEGLS